MKEPWEELSYPPDLEITIGDSIIKCHKPILALKSPVFKAMFETDKAEKNANKLAIDDIDKKTFLIFLKYLYAPEQKIDNYDLSIELLNTAHKYMVRPLIEVFNDNSKDFVTVENAIQCITIASQNKSSWREKLLDFIAYNYKFIRKNENFEVLKKDIDLMIDLFDKMTFDPELSFSRCQRDYECKIEYFLENKEPVSKTTSGGWVLTVSHETENDYIFLDVHKNQCDRFGRRFTYFVQIKGSCLSSYYEYSFNYDGSAIRKVLTTKQIYGPRKSISFEFMVNYWKLDHY